jgi:hypothetical protein
VHERELERESLREVPGGPQGADRPDGIVDAQITRLCRGRASQRSAASGDGTTTTGHG